MAGGYSAPGVYRKEIDLSNILVANGISNGGIVIRSQKGPIRRPVLVTTDKEFIETFGEPYYVSGTDLTHKLTPEYGYGAYGAIEFLKESNTLYVVRAYDDTDDKYAACKIKSDATEDTTFSSGVEPIESTELDIFDTRSYISSYNKFVETDSGYPLLVGFVGPGVDGNNYAVTVETLNPLSDWLYNYDNYPIESSATFNSVSATNPNGMYVVGQSDTSPIYVAPVWTSSGYQTSGFVYSDEYGIPSVSAGSPNLIIKTHTNNMVDNCNSSTLISACNAYWLGGYTQTPGDIVPPQPQDITFSYMTSALGSSATIGQFTTSAKPIKIEEIIGIDRDTYTFMIDPDNDGSYYKYEYTIGGGTIPQVDGVGGPQEVYKHYPLASNVVKVKVYAKPDDKLWTDLYANSADAAKGKVRSQPLEVFYGSMTPTLDNDGNELFIENAINGNSKYIYVKSNQRFATGTAPTASWDFATKTFKIPDFTDNAGYYVVNTSTGPVANRFAKLDGGTVDKTTGLTGDSEFWEYFKNREEIPVSILINTSSDTTTKMAVAEVCSSRKDCMSTNPVGTVYDLDIQNIMNLERYGYPAPSYVSLYAGYSQIYDKYNDKYVYLPNSIFAAAIFARVDTVSAPWFAPAGTARGTLAVLDQNKIFSTDQIGRMYDKNINAVKLVPGSGFVIWGQRTAQLKTSALTSINVRRNLIYIQVNIENALNQFIFENNTQQTRLRVFSIIDEFLNNIKASDGLYGYEVVCDNTNNPPSVIDANQLNVDIYVQPTKAIEFIQFTTVVTRTGVNFGDVKLKYA